MNCGNLMYNLKIMAQKIPNHVAIIMDGNRRWAKKNSIPSYEGHREGAKRMNAIADEAKKKGIPYLTVWAASIDNLKKRTRIEVNFLVSLFEQELEKILEGKTFEKNETRFRVIGKGAEIVKSKKLSMLIEEAEKNTRKFKKNNFTILFGYDGKKEMLDAIRAIREEKQFSYSYESVKAKLWTAALPPVDLVIRTGGEPHWSAGFLMWHTTDSHFYFTDTLWPDFGKKEFSDALTEFGKREKRLGK